MPSSVEIQSLQKTMFSAWTSCRPRLRHQPRMVRVGSPISKTQRCPMLGNSTSPYTNILNMYHCAAIRYRSRRMRGVRLAQLHFLSYRNRCIMLSHHMAKAHEVKQATFLPRALRASSSWQRMHQRVMMLRSNRNRCANGAKKAMGKLLPYNVITLRLYPAPRCQ